MLLLPLQTSRFCAEGQNFPFKWYTDPSFLEIESLQRDDPLKLDLARLEKVRAVATDGASNIGNYAVMSLNVLKLILSSFPDILTKPIEFQAAKPVDKKNGQDPSSVQDKEPHEGVLRELCGCDNCLKYRESVIHFYVEECEYNILWFRLQQIIEKHYELIDE